MSGKRTWLFRIISMALPLLLILLLECGLRWFHYGNDLSLFIEYPQNKNYLFLNPDASKRYFINQKNATTGNVEPFLKAKPAGTRRIFVLGESTTIGYPYFHNGSFHRWLQYRLANTFPDQHFEIVNLALTAVNSYTVLGFARELVDYQPDAVLIYAGHNEYYGAMGVGSTEKFGGNPALVNAVLRVRSLKIMQLAANLYQKVTVLDASGKSENDGTRMQRMVAEQQIPFQSDLYKRGVEQFRANMDEILDILAEHNVPVFISNLVSNEADLKPFFSFPLKNNQFPEDFEANAVSTYNLGKQEYARGNMNSARQYFSKARDLDGLRFRAPGAFNEIIGQLVKSHSNAHLVDTHDVFEANSPGGIIGKDLILEHVHPDLKGYALMSDAFYEALKKAKFISPAPGAEMSFAQLSRDMPVPVIDSLAGVYKVANLKNSWPFNAALDRDSVKTGTFEERVAFDLAYRRISWENAMDQAYNHYIESRNYKEAREIVEALILEQPNDAALYSRSAMLSGQLGDERSALFSFQKAFSVAPSFESARYLFVLFLKKDEPEKAIPYLDYAISNNTSGLNLAPVRTLVQEVVSLRSQLPIDSADISVLSRIASAYYRMDNRDGALLYARKVLALNAHDKDALQLVNALGHSQDPATR
ncbi:Tetratricopeptide repeat-containing protein [Dyadobacter soli]|uniref:Tetratricopeptide repeat-containing protein n=2 Tax=Dyadobacter soli TaxID=659014 RepID=A0A1G7NPG1_9BACT|nr:Tetratricopeptide repeat-containing protein [Dyadobacter soli]